MMLLCAVLLIPAEFFQVDLSAFAYTVFLIAQLVEVLPWH